MASIAEEIIRIIKSEYRYEMPQALEVRIKDLYDLGRITDVGDYDKIIYAVNNRKTELFKNKKTAEGALSALLEKRPVEINFLLGGSDLGESSYGALIAIENALKQENDPVKANWFVIAQSPSVGEKIKNPAFSYDQILDANERELNYLVNKIDYYTARSDISSKLKVIDANPFSLPLKDSSMDCAILTGYSKFIRRGEAANAFNEIYRILKPDGFCFTDETDAVMLDKTPFMAGERGDLTYYLKKRQRENAKDEITYRFCDAVEFYKNKKYQEASMIIHGLISMKDEIDMELYKLLLLIYIRQGDSFKIEYIERMLKMNNINDADFDFIIGSYYFNKNDYAKAEGYLNKSLDEEPALVFAQYYLALIEKLRGKMESSRKRFMKIVESIEGEKFYAPELYSELVSVEMIGYIAQNEIEGV